MPKRIQYRRNKHLPKNTKYVGRPSVWGNPFTVREYGRERCIELFRLRAERLRKTDPEAFEKWIAPLRGKDVACWCSTNESCHGDVLLELAALPPLKKKEERLY